MSTDADELVRALFTASQRPVDDSVAFAKSVPRHARTIDDAILGGAFADRLAYAFVAGYRAALRCLAPSIDSVLVSLCATEEGGAHPRGIATKLLTNDDGATILRGVKRFATLGDVAETLLVVASIGEIDGKNRLRVASVPRARAGVKTIDVIETAFCPEVRHAVLSFDDVAIDRDEILPGDGWDDLVKPFRTIEDAHVHAAILAHLFTTIADPSTRASILTALLGVRATALLEPKRAETHVALAGSIAQTARVLDAIDWSAIEPSIRARWERDRGLLHVATKARELRLQAAWRTLSETRTIASRNRPHDTDPE